MIMVDGGSGLVLIGDVYHLKKDLLRPALHTAPEPRETGQFAPAMEMFIPTLVRCRGPHVDR